jgi:hypothetical protein
MTLTEFLLARIYDDECLARMAFADHNGNGPDWSEQWSGAVEMGGDEHELLLCNDSGVSRHIENFDPARVLAECEAKRRILVTFSMIEKMPRSGLQISTLEWDVMEDSVKALAWVYSNHPDYLPEWKPLVAAEAKQQ